MFGGGRNAGLHAATKQLPKLRTVRVRVRVRVRETSDKDVRSFSG